MFSRRSVRTQFGLIFVGFLLLVAGSVAATLLTLRAHTTDTHLINLAGQQRTLVHRMTWLALIQPDAPALTASMDLEPIRITPLVKYEPLYLGGNKNLDNYI